MTEQKLIAAAIINDLRLDVVRKLNHASSSKTKVEKALSDLESQLKSLLQADIRTQGQLTKLCTEIHTAVVAANKVIRKPAGCLAIGNDLNLFHRQLGPKVSKWYTLPEKLVSEEEVDFWQAVLAINHIDSKNRLKSLMIDNIKDLAIEEIYRFLSAISDSELSADTAFSAVHQISKDQVSQISQLSKAFVAYVDEVVNKFLVELENGTQSKVLAELLGDFDMSRLTDDVGLHASFQTWVLDPVKQGIKKGSYIPTSNLIEDRDAEFELGDRLNTTDILNKLRPVGSPLPFGKKEREYIESVYDNKAPDEVLDLRQLAGQVNDLFHGGRNLRNTKSLCELIRNYTAQLKSQEDESNPAPTQDLPASEKNLEIPESTQTVISQAVIALLKNYNSLAAFETYINSEEGQRILSNWLLSIDNMNLASLQEMVISIAQAKFNVDEQKEVIANGERESSSLGDLKKTEMNKLEKIRSDLEDLLAGRRNLQYRLIQPVFELLKTSLNSLSLEQVKKAVAFLTFVHAMASCSKGDMKEEEVLAYVLGEIPDPLLPDSFTRLTDLFIEISRQEMGLQDTINEDELPNISEVTSDLQLIEGQLLKLRDQVENLSQANDLTFLDLANAGIIDAKINEEITSKTETLNEQKKLKVNKDDEIKAITRLTEEAVSLLDFKRVGELAKSGDSLSEEIQVIESRIQTLDLEISALKKERLELISNKQTELQSDLESHNGLLARLREIDSINARLDQLRTIKQDLERQITELYKYTVEALSELAN